MLPSSSRLKCVHGWQDVAPGYGLCLPAVHAVQLGSYPVGDAKPALH